MGRDILDTGSWCILRCASADTLKVVKARSTDWHGDRLVNNTILQEVLGIYQKAKANYDAKVTALVDDAPELILEAAGKIGD